MNYYEWHSTEAYIIFYTIFGAQSRCFSIGLYFNAKETEGDFVLV